MFSYVSLYAIFSTLPSLCSPTERSRSIVVIRKNLKQHVQEYNFCILVLK
jgi:hypothetical protein